jgi:hypothetical protein
VEEKTGKKSKTDADSSEEEGADGSDDEESD